MQTIEGFDFVALRFDGEGHLPAPDELKSLTDHVNAASATDAILIAHGFRNSEAGAQTLYTNFLQTFRAHCDRPELKPAIAGRRIVVAGVFWPSRRFREVDDFDEGTVQELSGDVAGEARVRAELEELRDQDARPDQRPKIDRAINLLPKLNRPEHAGRIR